MNSLTKALHLLSFRTIKCMEIVPEILKLSKPQHNHKLTLLVARSGMIMTLHSQPLQPPALEFYPGSREISYPIIDNYMRPS